MFRLRRHRPISGDILRPQHHRPTSGDILTNILIAAPVLGAMALTSFGAERAWEAWIESKDNRKFKESFKEMMKIRPSLKDQDPKLVSIYFKSLASHSPSLAKDPLAAGAYIQNAIQMHETGGGVMPSVISELTDIEEKRRKQKGRFTESPTSTYKSLLPSFASAGLKPLITDV